MSEEILNKEENITSWLDCVDYPDVEEFIKLYNSCLPYNSSKVRYELSYIEDDKKPKFEIKYIYGDNSRPYIMYLGEFGPVNMFGDSEIVTSGSALGIYKNWYAILKRKNQGVLIDGKTYDEAIKDFYKEQNRKYYAPKINKLTQELNKIVRLQQNADDALQSMIDEFENSEMGE